MLSSGASLNARSVVFLDGLAAAMFVVFVAFLFVGYENWVAKVPFSTLSPIPLLGALLTLFYANLRADRASRGVPSP